MESETLRARLGKKNPADQMPSDVAELDRQWAGQDLAKLVPRLRSVSDPRVVLQDLNWERARIFEGAGFIMAYAYMSDLWRLGSSMTPPVGDQLKQSASMVFAYSLDLVALDGVKCSDPSAPGHRHDQLMFQNMELIKYLAGLPRATRMAIGTLSLAVEKATEPLRKDDEVLCGNGMDQMTASLKAMGNISLPQAPAAPGSVGKTILVPAPPGYRPSFEPAEVWRPKQAELRARMPALLTRILAVPSDTVDSGSKPAESVGPEIFYRPSTDHPAPPPLYVPPEAVPPQVEWIRLPSGDDMRRYYPDLAERKGVEGRATIKCRINLRGTLEQCRIMAEVPTSLGFGQAAVAMADAGLFQMRSPRQFTEGTSMVVPISFKINRTTSLPPASPTKDP